MAKSLGGAIRQGVLGATIGAASYKANELMEEAKSARAMSLEGKKQEGRMELQGLRESGMASRAEEAFKRTAGETIAGYDPKTLQAITRTQVEENPALGKGMLSKYEAEAKGEQGVWNKKLLRENEAYLLGKTRAQRELQDKYDTFVKEGGTKGWSDAKIKKHKASIMTGIPQPEIAKLRVTDEMWKLAYETVEANSPEGTPAAVKQEDVQTMVLRMAKLGQVPSDDKDRYMGDVRSKENPTGSELPEPSKKLTTMVTRARDGNYGAKQQLKKEFPKLVEELGEDGAVGIIEDIVGKEEVGKLLESIASAKGSGGMIDSAPPSKVSIGMPKGSSKASSAGYTGSDRSLIEETQAMHDNYLMSL